MAITGESESRLHRSFTPSCAAWEETAHALGVSVATIGREQRMVEAWLHREVGRKAEEVFHKALAVEFDRQTKEAWGALIDAVSQSMIAAGELKMSNAALGFRAHSGWAIVVAVAGSPARPLVIERRGIEIASSAILGSKQPYHAAERLDTPQAEAWIRQCRDSSTHLSTGALSTLAAQLADKGHTVVGVGILFASGRPLPDLAKILQSHALIHTAEGEFFREALVSASEHCSLPVTRVKEREAWDSGAAMFGLSPADLQQRIGDLGRSLGPPWRQDEKLAALAAWIALANRLAV